MGKKLGTAGSIVTRKSLKKKRPMSDAALIASAERAAKKHQEALAKGCLHSA